MIYPALKDIYIQPELHAYEVKRDVLILTSFVFVILVSGFIFNLFNWSELLTSNYTFIY